MKTCPNCSKEFSPKRGDNLYCSKSCKNSASRARRNQNRLSDALPIPLSPQPQRQFAPVPVAMPMYRPQQPRYDSVSSHISRQVGNFVGGGLADGYDAARRTKSLMELGILFTAGVGGFWLCDSKKTTDKLLWAGFGLMLGGIANHALNLWNESQPQQLPMSPMEYGVASGGSQLQDKMISSEQLGYLQIPSLNFAKTWIGHFIGENVNSNFSMVLSGSPGGGKSHLSAQFASVFGRIGKTLIVLSEEGITTHVQARLQNYNLQNTSVFASKDANAILQAVRQNGIQFLVLDSLQGVSANMFQQVAFMRALKNVGLLGNVVILQVGKNGDAKGRMEIQHEADCLIEVENGTATVGKNRFGESGKSWNIFARSENSNVRVLPMTRQVASS